MPNQNPLTEQRLSKMLDAMAGQVLKSVYVGGMFNMNLIGLRGFVKAAERLGTQLEEGCKGWCVVCFETLRS